MRVRELSRFGLIGFYWPQSSQLGRPAPLKAVGAAPGKLGSDGPPVFLALAKLLLLLRDAGRQLVHTSRMTRSPM